MLVSAARKTRLAPFFAPRKQRGESTTQAEDDSLSEVTLLQCSLRHHVGQLSKGAGRYGSTGDKPGVKLSMPLPAPEETTDLMTDRISIAFASAGNVLQLIEDGKVTALARATDPRCHDSQPGHDNSSRQHMWQALSLIACLPHSPARLDAVTGMADLRDVMWSRG
jgi:hypothetical protein